MLLYGVVLFLVDGVEWMCLLCVVGDVLIMFEQCGQSGRLVEFLVFRVMIVEQVYNIFFFVDQVICMFISVIVGMCMLECIVFGSMYGMIGLVFNCEFLNCKY